MSTLTECVLGKSDDPHADKIKALYLKLQELGNNEEWQLHVLHVLTEGVEAKVRERRAILDIINKRTETKDNEPT